MAESPVHAAPLGSFSENAVVLVPELSGLPPPLPAGVTTVAAPALVPAAFARRIHGEATTTPLMNIADATAVTRRERLVATRRLKVMVIGSVNPSF